MKQVHSHTVLCTRNPAMFTKLTPIPSTRRPSIQPAVHLFMVLVLLILSSCATFQTTPREMIAASYLAIETLAESTQEVFDAGRISNDTRQEIRAELQKAQTATDGAKRAIATNDTMGSLQFLNISFAAIEIVRGLLPPPD